MVVMENNNKKLVVKHNKLIEFKGRMSVCELKLFGLIIADIREQQEGRFEEYKVDLTILKETTNHNNFYDYMKEVALKLESKRMIVEDFDQENKKYFTTIRLIHKPKYRQGDNFLTIELDKDLIPYILDLKREFTRYQIENILRLKSCYSVRVYELLKQYESIGKRTISILELREILGIDLEEYQRFYDFEKWVLKQSQREINEHTDLNISYNKNKRGRNIESLTFTIVSKEDNQYINYLNQSYNIKEFKEKAGIESENFNSKQVLELYEVAVDMLIDDYKSEADLFEYIRLNYLFMKEKKGIKNPFNYLIKALKGDHAVARGQIKFDYPID